MSSSPGHSPENITSAFRPMSNVEIQQETKIRIAICGGGIGGLCLAVALVGHSHLDVQLYESAAQFKEIGAGVMIWARTWKILERMGLAQDFSKIAHSPPTGEQGIGFDYRRSDSPSEGFRFKLVEMPCQYLPLMSCTSRLKHKPADGCIRFHRAEFLDVFINHLQPGMAHFGKRIVSYSHVDRTRSVDLTFADGTTASCDILIGADGIKSTIRAQMFRETASEKNDPTLLRFIEPIWTGTMAYRGLIRLQDLPRGKNKELHRTIGAPMMYCGKNKHVVSYSISQGDIINVVTFASEPQKNGSVFSGEWVVDCPQSEVLNCYAGWEPEVEDLLRCIKNPTRWAIHHLLPLPFYQRKNVVLLGDAAHAMSPHQGAGAGQAIEDAFILAALLSQAQPSNLFQILHAYEAIRLPMANDIVAESYHSGMMYEFNSEYGEEYDRLGPAIQRQWDWIDKVSLDEEVASALSMARQKSPSKL